MSSRTDLLQSLTCKSRCRRETVLTIRHSRCAVAFRSDMLLKPWLPGFKYVGKRSCVERSGIELVFLVSQSAWGDSDVIQNSVSAPILKPVPKRMGLVRMPGADRRHRRDKKRNSIGFE